VTLEEAREHTGEKVVYSTRPGEADEGLIDSVSDRYVFVCYGRHNPRATYAHNLTLMRGRSLAEHIRLGMEEAGFGLATEEDE
jgi:hypothetical protein